MGKFFSELGDKLSLYVKTVAWLSAIPKARGRPNNIDNIALPDATMSRAEEMESKGLPLPLPECPCQQIYDWLMEIGPFENGGMGRSALSWREIDAWCARTGIDLAPGIAVLIRRLSVDFTAELGRAEDPNAPPPYTAPVVDRPAVANAVRTALASFLGR